MCCPYDSLPRKLTRPGSDSQATFPQHTATLQPGYRLGSVQSPSQHGRAPSGGSSLSADASVFASRRTSLRSAAGREAARSQREPESEMGGDLRAAGGGRVPGEPFASAARLPLDDVNAPSISVAKQASLASHASPSCAVDHRIEPSFESSHA